MPHVEPSRRQSLTPGELVARLERIPSSRWHLRARVVMGSATFFDAFDALSLWQAACSSAHSALSHQGPLAR